MYGCVFIIICLKVFFKISSLISSGKDTSDIHCLLSYFYKELGNKDGYKQELDNAYTLDANNKDVLNAFGQYYTEIGEKEYARQYFELSLFLYPEQPDIKAKKEKL